MYKFILENQNLKKLTIKKNPISEKYSVEYEKVEDEKDMEKYLIKDENKKIIINDFYSFLLKIKYELSERKDLNIECDCAYDINLSSQKYPYKTQPIVFKS